MTSWIESDPIFIPLQIYKIALQKYTTTCL
jgi:hypothetical protein